MWSDEEEDLVVDKTSWDIPWKREQSNCDSIPSNDEENKTLFVSGLSLGTSQDDLQKLFSQFRSITRVNVIDRKKSSHHHPNTKYGFVTFDCKEDATAAIDQLNKTKYRGQVLEVSWCKKTRTNNTVTNCKQYDEDDGNLYRLIEVYTCAKCSHGKDLPNLHLLLHEMQALSNKLTRPHQDNDYAVNINLTAVHQSFINRVTQQQGNTTGDETTKPRPILINSIKSNKPENG